MAIAALTPAGDIGIVQDINPAELAPTAWSDGRNVQFQDGAVHSAPTALPLLTDIGFSPNWCMPVAQTSGGLAAWVIASPTKLYAYVANELTDITRIAGDYTGGSTFRWNGDVLSGVTVLNNFTDGPQVWMSSNPLTPVVALPNWNTNWKTQVLRSYKQYLIALDVTKSGARYPTLVKWSHPADPGTYPVSWDETDPTRDAGEYPLSETPGAVVDCLPLKDVNIIYKTDSVWGMQWVGGTYIFRFYKIFSDFGIANRDCAVEFSSGKHFVFTGTDLVVHDGQNSQSVASGRLRKRLRTLDTAQLRSSFVTTNPLMKEVWMCYRAATDGGLNADTAIVWNWESGALSLRDLDDYAFMASGRFDPPVTGLVSWGTINTTWEAVVGEWGEAVTIPSLIRLLAISGDSLLWAESNLNSSQYCFVERTHLGVQMESSAPPDLSRRKFISRIWPRITGKVGTVVYITLGASDDVMKDITWLAPRQYVLGDMTSLDVILTGKMFGIRLESTNQPRWTYNGLDVEVKPAGRW